MDAPYQIFSLGDSAITIDFGNVINETLNDRAVSLFRYLNQHPFPGMIEAVPAYSSLTIYYDVPSIKKFTRESSAHSYVEQKLLELIKHDVPSIGTSKEIIRIPVCYKPEFGPDLQEISATKNISTDEIVQFHCSKPYRVYMLGFLPGFAYMGELDERIAMPRKKDPRIKIEAGSVGIAGKQTGIYPLESPGGWQIIGRTPLKLFDPTKDNPTILEAGDTIQFYSISKHEFEDHQGGHS